MRARPAPAIFGATRARAAVTALCAGAMIAGCSSEPAPAPASSSATSSPERAPIVTNAVEPAQHLLPADISDSSGERVASLLFRGLVRYDAKGKLTNEAAEGVESVGDVFYRVKLRKGWVFGNGEPVTARSFVDAWNWAVMPSRQQLHADAYAPIVGYASVRGLPEPIPVPLPPAATATPSASGAGSTGATASPSPNGASAAPTRPPTPSPATPPAPRRGGAAPTTMTGLSVVDDLTFTIRLVRPDPSFIDQLARLPYVPLPKVTLADPARYAVAPVGNGPYQLAPGGWVAHKEVRLIPNASYSGGDVARNAGLTFRFFADPSMTYPLLRSGRLDVLDDVPIPDLGRYRAEVGFRGANQPVGKEQTLVFPMHRPEWATADARRVRLAISRSIDRKALADTLFAGTRAKAGDLAAPVVAGYAPDLCGATCAYDPGAALAQMGLLVKTPAPLVIAYGVDGGGGPTVEAICATVTHTLSLGCTSLPYPSQSALERAVTTRTVTTPVLFTWVMDRPELGGFLAPRFLAGSSRNPSGYAGGAAQAQLATAAAATTSEARNAAYQDAERSVLSELPEIPLWDLNATVTRGERVGEVRTDVFGVPIYTEIERP
ncbi:MAG: ABC transporter substrate-binding protein [Dermatophilaceae bacterium]